MELPYELNVTPRASIDSQTTTSKTITPSITATTNNNTNAPQHTGPTPSIRLLFSILPRRYIPLLLLPAILSSLVAGGIAPFMTYVVGQVFNTFAQFPLTSPTQTDKDNLLSGIGIAALQLIALAVGSMALGSLTSALWIWLGEINVKAVREYVYEEVAGKDVAWFDLITANDASSSEEAIGAAGLMAKFSRETDEVRQASSLALGTILQSLTTVLACLVLAFTSSYQLTLVILSAVPLLTFLQALSQILATPLLAAERHSTAVAATRVERAISAIATVKAFNAEKFEETRANGVFLVLRKQADKLNAVWAFSSGSAQFVMMAMFVQGFWFGAKLVREGKVQPGVVMAVFWACLIATSSLQMCIPHLITLAKGKSAMAALMTIAQSPSPPPASTSNSNNTEYPPHSSTATTPAHPRALRKIVPQKCTGELSLTSVSFTYPSRPSQPALSSVSLFLPAGETTYIVGASGSGKSTVAALLAGMYRADEGVVGLDEQDVRFLDEEWVRGQVMCVVQGGVVVIDGRSVADNILAGVDEDLLQRLSASEKENKIRAAAQAALLSEWVLGLENGYDTILAGSGTASSEENSSVDTERSVQGIRLSGGQLQRLALARAFARQPTVLVLDEATSALDPAGRLLVSAALRRQRQGASSFSPTPTSAYPVPLHHTLSSASPVSTNGQQKRSLTTVIITHDLTGIEADDFVYVMSQGQVVEGGYRCDLEREGGEFGRMWGMQGGSSGSALVDEEESEDDEESELEESEVEEEDKELPTHRPLTFGNWMFEVVADLTGATGRSSVWGGRPAPSTTPAAAAPITIATPTTTNATTTEKPKRKTRPASISIVVPSSPLTHNRRYSLPYTPTSAATTIVNPAPWGSSANKKSVYGGKDEEESDVEEAEFGVQKNAVQRSGARAREGRVGGSGRERRVWVREAQAQVVSEKKGRRTKRSRRVQQTETSTETFDAPPAFWRTLLSILPTIPHKTVLLFSLFVCLASGALTPVFSFLLSRLLFEVSIGARDPALINKYGGLVLGVAAADGVLLGMKYFLMEWVAGAWTTSLRSKAFATTLSRPKAHFDSSSQNSSSHLSAARVTQSIVRDADDARNLVSVVLAQGAVVSAMVGVGLVWALVRGWQLTLAGFAIAPVFAGVMALQAGLVGKCEGRNKRAREEVARGYYETIINIRGIRCTSLHRIFRSQFLASTVLAKRTGVKGALVEGCTHGVASALIYLAEALLFYIGAVLIAQGKYTYLQMVETLNLVVFSVTIGAQLMAFTERIAKATQATADLQRLLSVQETEEDKNPEQGGWLKSQVGGEIIKFENVAFTYPSAPTVPVLRDVSLTINPGECIALVGASGSGKSTLAALLQKLYTPVSGTISIGAIPLPEIETKHLREHLAVVSQHPALFDASIAENIRYGSPASIITDRDVRSAAKKARVHDFVMGLEGGYETNVGENAGLISGGQGQRLAIARALARPSADVLVLDECTSALDAENQAGVLETIAALRTGEDREKMTTVMVTHKVGVMQMCDRVVVLKDGEVVESGTYHALMERKGVFATLARAGEWVG